MDSSPGMNSDQADANDRERAFFDNLVQEEGDFNPFSIAGWNTLKAGFTRFTRPAGNLRLLDIGCGTGQSRQIYVDCMTTYTGIDLSEKSIKQAKSVFTGDEFLVADACHLPFPDNTFDFIAFSGVLHHINDFTVAVKEAFRVVKPNGTVFSFDPHSLHPAYALFRNPKSPFYLSRGVSPNERPLFGSALRKAYREAGLIDVRTLALSGISYRRVAVPLMNTLL